MKIYVDTCLEADEETAAVLKAAGHELVSEQECEIALLVSPEPEEVARLVNEGHRVVPLEIMQTGGMERMGRWFLAGATDVLDRPYSSGAELGRRLLGIIETALSPVWSDQP